MKHFAAKVLQRPFSRYERNFLRLSRSITEKLCFDTTPNGDEETMAKK